MRCCSLRMLTVSGAVSAARPCRGVVVSCMSLPLSFQNANSKCGKGSKVNGAVSVCVSGVGWQDGSGAGECWGWSWGSSLGNSLGQGSGPCFGLGVVLGTLPGGCPRSGPCFGVALPSVLALPSVFALSLASQKPISHRNPPQPLLWVSLGFYHRIPDGSGLEGTLQLIPSLLWAGTPSPAPGLQLSHSPQSLWENREKTNCHLSTKASLL